MDIEDLIPEETCVFTLTHEGYIKRTAVDTYSAQNRGGRGVAGMTQKDNDFTEELFVGSTHDYMLFMTDKGRVYRLKGYQVAEGSRTAKGSHIANLLQLQGRGLAGVAVVSAIFAQADPCAASRELYRLAGQL